MFTTSNISTGLRFERRVIGTSSRVHRDSFGVLQGDSVASSSNSCNMHALSHGENKSPSMGATSRSMNGCTLEMLSPDPPLVTHKSSLAAAGASATSAMLTPKSSTKRSTDGRRQNVSPLFLRSTDDYLGVDDSVVVEGVDPTSPVLCLRSNLPQPARRSSLTDIPDRRTGVGGFATSPQKRDEAHGKKVVEQNSESSGSRAAGRWHSASVGGVTHGSVTRSQDSIESGPLRVSLAHKALIGKGSFGVVFQAMDRDTNHIIAVKEIAFNGASSKTVEALRKELALLKELDHPHIVKCLGEECDNNCLRIYLEYVSGGSISSVLRTFGPFCEKQASIYARQMLSGLSYLHSRNIIHRDLKGDNLLVDPNGTLKISDFGTAKHLLDTQNHPTLAGTAYFMAPEVILSSSNVGLASDVWSVGCCVIEMLTGEPPFAEVRNQYAMMMRVAETQGELFPVMIPPKGLSDKVVNFLHRCLQRDPERRPKTHELLSDPWIISPPEDTHDGGYNGISSGQSS